MSLLSKLKAIDIAFYLFLLTGLGYVVTYLYQWGYYNYFSIPSSFIDISVSTITKSFVYLGVFFSFIIINVAYFDGKSRITKFAIKFFTFRILTKKILNIFLQVVLCLSVLYFLGVWLLKEQSGGIDYLAFALLLFTAIWYLKDNLKLIITCWLILMFMIPYLLGWSNARIQKEFYIIDHKSNYLIIDILNNNAIAAKFDIKSHKIYPDFKLISVDSLADDKKELQLVKLNELKVEQAITIK